MTHPTSFFVCDLRVAKLVDQPPNVTMRLIGHCPEPTGHHQAEDHTRSIPCVLHTGRLVEQKAEKHEHTNPPPAKLRSPKMQFQLYDISSRHT